MIENTAGTGSGNYTFNNNSENGTGPGTATLNIGGAISGNATTGNTTLLTFKGNAAVVNRTAFNTISGVISNGSSGGNLDVNIGSGLTTTYWRLTGNNTFTGNVTIISGGSVLSVASDANLGLGSNIEVQQNSKFQTTSSFATSKNIILAGGNPHIQVGAGTTLTLNGHLGANGTAGPTGTAARIDGAGNLVLNGSGAFSSNLTVISLEGAGGTLSFGNATALTNATLRMNDATSILDNTSGGSLALTGLSGLEIQTAFTFNGTSSLDLSGAVSTSFIGNANATRTITVNNNTLTLGGILTTGTDVAGTTRVNGALTKNGTGTLILTGASDFTGCSTVTATVINAGTLQIGNGGSTGSLAPAGLISNNATLAFSRNNTVTQGTDFNSTISGTGNVVQNGSGNLILATGNTYSGNTTVNGAGTGSITIGADSGLGAAPGVATASHLVLNNGGLVTTGTFVLAAERGILLAGSGGQFNTANGTTLTYNGTIAGSSLQKAGLGVLNLGGTNSYTGGTSVDAGTLLVNGSLSTGNVTVASGATLGGGGTIGGATTISGTHSPGNSPGLQTFVSDLNYDSTAVFKFELIDNTVLGRGTNYDAVNVGGDLNITSGAKMDLVLNGGITNFTDTFWTSNHSWSIFGVTGGIGGTFALGSISLDSLGQAYTTYGTFNVAAGTNNLNWVAVPEPSAWLLAAFGLTTAVVFRRRRRD